MRISEYIAYGNNRENKKNLCYESQMKQLDTTIATIFERKYYLLFRIV